jgi:hypothetical protein
MASTIQQIETPKRARALDTSGNNNHGQIYSGRGLEFDGVTDHLTGPTDINTSHGITNTITVACWIKTSAFGAVQNPWNFFEDTNDGWGLEIKTDEKICFRDDIDGDLPGQADTMTYENLIQLNTWYRVVGVLDNLEQKLYINGTLVGSGTNVNDGLDSFNSALFIGKRGNSTHYFNGAMTDFQIWDTAWSADDVTYDYLNPESLALNRGGTLLTESNLKIWYPMQDGHRGQQSYISDGSNTGLGDETITNGSFTGITQAVDTTGSEWTTRAGWTISGGKAHRDGSGGSNSDIEQSILVVDGTTYKFSYTRTYASGAGQTNVYIRTNNVDYVTVGSYTSTTVEEHTVTRYFTALFTGSMPFRVFGIGTWTGTFDNISVKPVNDKNNATTVFYGDNQISSNHDKDFRSGGTVNWANATSGSIAWDTYDEAATSGADESTALTQYDGTTVTFSDNYLKLAVTSDASNVKLANLDGNHWEDSNTMVAGRTYRLGFAMDMTAYTSGTLTVGFGQDDGTIDTAADKQFTNVVSSSPAAYYFDFIYKGTTTHAKIFLKASVSSAFTVYFDNFSLKEVGTASGWTDADQQLHIPQTALQSYNELLWMQGQEVDGTETDNVPITINSNVWNPASNNVPAGSALDWNTISAWIFFTEDSLNNTAFLLRIEGGDPNLYMVVSGDNIKIGLNTGSGEVVGTTYPKSSLVNKWNHIVFAWKPISHIEQYGTNIYDMAFGTINGSGVSTGTATAVINDTDADGSTDLTDITLSSIPGAMTRLSRLKYMKGTTRPATTGGGNENCAIITNINTDTNTITFNDAIAFENGETITVDLYDADNFDSHVRLWINGEKLSVTQTSNYHSNNIATSAQDNLEIGDSETNTTAYSHQGIMTEISAWNKNLSTSEVEELYNDGKPLDALTHSALTNLKGYWRNNGLDTWKDLVQSNNGVPSSTCQETMIIPQGLDNRDSQGFLMNRQRNTSSLNLPLLDTVFTNSSDHVDVGTIFNNDIFSLCCWIKVPNTGVIQRIVDNRNDSVEGWQLYVDASGNIKFSIGDTSGGATVTEDTLGDVDPDTWIHVAVTYAGSAGTISTYINGGGKQTSTATGVQNQSLITTAMKIGSRNFSNVEYGTKGQIDGVLFYTDVLSDAEVKRNYNATKGSHKN